MSDAGAFYVLPGLRVTVDRVVYRPDAAAPPDRPHCFAYFVTIHNAGSLAVTIRGRKWVVTNDQGDVVVVEGDGVIGQMPRVEPGESFSYNSFHLLDGSSAEAEGSYFGVDDKNRRILVKIPKFKMEVPVRN